MAAAVAKIPGHLTGLEAVSVDPNRSVREPTIAPAVVPHPARLRLRAPRNDHEGRFVPDFDSGTEDRTYLESLIREDFERCHPGETLEYLKRRVLFEGGQRPAAGLDGGSSGSRRSRIQGQGVAIVAGSNRDSTRLSRRIEQLRHGGSQLRWRKGLPDQDATVDAL